MRFCFRNELVKLMIAAVCSGAVAFFAGCGMNESANAMIASHDELRTPPFARESDSFPGVEKHGELWYNGFVYAADDNLSTFGADVDAGSYTFGRKKLEQGILPDPASVRVEEYINYFDQEYAPPPSDPFSIHLEAGPSLFRAESLHVLRIGLRGRDPAPSGRTPWNLTFLVDISGSMTSRLSFVKSCLYTLIDAMAPGDKIAVCTYAGGVGTPVSPRSVTEQNRIVIKQAIADLRAGGGTAMASGIQNAYNVTMSAFIPGGVNRVIVCSDGDANIGAASHQAILSLIDSYVDEGVTLTTLGFGQGNYNDFMMEQLANKGDGNYFYVDGPREAERLFSGGLAGMIEVIARDVKIQIEFNPRAVHRYRLIGYENRDIADEDFSKDTTDAGEIGAGHTVTALYELELIDSSSEDLGVVRLRYKAPEGGAGIPLDAPIERERLGEGSRRFRFTQAIAEYAELLRESPYASSSLDQAQANLSAWHDPSREKDVELLGLAQTAVSLAGR